MEQILGEHPFILATAGNQGLGNRADERHRSALLIPFALFAEAVTQDLACTHLFADNGTELLSVPAQVSQGIGLMQMLICSKDSVLSILSQHSSSPFCSGIVSCHLRRYALAADKLEACDSALQHSRRVGTYMMEGDKRGKRGSGAAAAEDLP